MPLDLKKVAAFIRTAETDDLLDRVTVYRGNMEPAAVDLMENELWRRGLTPEQVAEHRESRANALRHPDGTAVKCHFCDRPAVERSWGWHRLWGKVPLFPRLFSRCDEHAAKSA